MNELAAEVRRRAGDRCEYCRLPQVAFRRPFHVEHIIAQQHGGLTELGNLALACGRCNLKKGPNLAGLDSETGEIVPLFHPRKDTWDDHFAVRVAGSPQGVEIQGLTRVGRATVAVLGINEDLRQMLRYELWLEGLYAKGG